MDGKVSALSIAQSGREYHNVFQYFDKDGDGKISPSELRACLLKTIGEEPPQEEIEALVSSVDSDGDGMLDIHKFLELMDGEVGVEQNNSELREAFRMYEMDGRGYITPASSKKVLQELGDDRSVQDSRAMIRKFDLNGDGALSFEEFKVMMV